MNKAAIKSRLFIKAQAEKIERFADLMEPYVNAPRSGGGFYNQVIKESAQAILEEIEELERTKSCSNDTETQ